MMNIRTGPVDTFSQKLDRLREEIQASVRDAFTAGEAAGKADVIRRLNEARVLLRKLEARHATDCSHADCPFTEVRAWLAAS